MEETQAQPENGLPTAGFAAKIEGDQISFGPGFAVQVSAQKDVTMSQAGALAVAAGADMDLSFGGGLVVAVGRDQQLTNGGALQISVGRDQHAADVVVGMVNAGKSVDLSDSVALIAAAKQVTVQNSVVGMLVSPGAQLGEGTSRGVEHPPGARFWSRLWRRLCHAELAFPPQITPEAARMRDENPTVYSSEHGRLCPNCGRPIANCICKKAVPTPGDGVIRVRLDLKARKGKTVTVISGLPLDEDNLRALLTELKRRCGTGGALKEGLLEIQGDHRDVVIAELKKRGLSAKKAGG